MSSLAISLAISLYLCLATLLALPTHANTEVLPLLPRPLCRADAQGHSALRASLTLSANWPALSADGVTSLFALGVDREEHGEQQQPQPRVDRGYWLRVVFDGHGPASTSSSFPLLEDDDTGEDSDGDGPFVVRAWESASKASRYALDSFLLRASWPANHPVDVALSIHTPEDMLRLGGTSWRVKPVGHSREADDGSGGGGGGGDGAEDSINVNVSATATASNSTATASASASASASGTHAPQRPCPVAYLHVRASRGARTAVRIPPASAPSSHAHAHSWLTRALARLAEVYMSPLSPASATQAQASEGETQSHTHTRVQVPLHLTLEPLPPPLLRSASAAVPSAVRTFLAWWLAAPGAPSSASASAAAAVPPSSSHSSNSEHSSSSTTSTAASLLLGGVALLVLLPALLQGLASREGDDGGGGGAQRGRKTQGGRLGLGLGWEDWTVVGLVRRAGKLVEGVSAGAGSCEAEESREKGKGKDKVE